MKKIRDIVSLCLFTIFLITVSSVPVFAAKTDAAAKQEWYAFGESLAPFILAGVGGFIIYKLFFKKK